ncbi:acyl-CoA dehydrogenase family protein [Sapientia aquatica]|uniref:Acyl-CoA dehydrogenase n=1 Tax=Sapientia aquatica TaxID=1549640 RepID=A0A4R5W141_9BURK|nr:acyl-CoA dehydrogenase family protein [Sapientia aquatica]TDK65735.1 acyl-CoA dehydrogenase [Sapientia aquatica]
MNFSLSPELRDLQERTRRFISEEVIPFEHDSRLSSHGPSEGLREMLVDKARKHQLLTPHANKEFGGLGLSHLAKAIVFEEAGYSPLGPVALNIHAPDEGNIHLLEVVATEAQKERWLRPLVLGFIRSCFCMTEPAPGSGSDPGMLRTTAVRAGDDYLINGTKWFITGASGASCAIIMARMEDGTATMFLVDTDQAGFNIERQIDTLDTCFVGGHCVVKLDNLRVPATDVLGQVGEGFRYAQVRLAPARLTHCMRWQGAARRAHDTAADYARTRYGFGKPLIEHEGVGFKLADNQIDLHSARLVIWHCAWLLDQGEQGRHESSLAKVLCSEAQWRTVDRSVQILGASGVSDETIVARIFRDMRAFQIYDGPSETHRWSIANRIARE